jgi:hypothetical protein
LHWDSRTKAKFVGLIQPSESITTVTIPGNSFHVTLTYDPNDALVRWTVTSDEAVLFYDPYEENKNGLDRLSPSDLKKYHMHDLNRMFGREYLAMTQRQWLTTSPRPIQMHHMWDANYFGQEHIVKTKQTHFITTGEEEEGGTNEETSLFKQLDYDDYDKMVEKQKKGDENAFVSSPQLRKGGEIEVTLRVISAAPSVFEISNFLRPTEVDHLLVENRMAIMKIHSRKMNLLRNIDLKTVAEKMHLAKRYNITNTEQKSQ